MALIRFFAPCPRGLEAPLAAELRALGAGILGEPPGGVQFEGDTRIGLAANLHSRIASRILQQVASAPYNNEDDLYRIASETPWETWHEPLASLRIDISSSGSTLHSLQFATLRIKDGVVDRLRERYGERPSIERQRPDRRIFAFLDASQCTLYLDWSGESLFKRGWRRDGADAPLDRVVHRRLEADRRGLRHAVGDRHLLHVHVGERAAHHLDGAGRAGHDAGAQAAQVVLGEQRAAQHGDPHRGRQEELADAVLRHQRQQPSTQQIQDQRKLHKFNERRAPPLSSNDPSHSGSFACDPSQNGSFPECLHAHIATVFSSVSVNFTGASPVPLCDPSQNGWVFERPHEHHQ
jgi:hypothetical protein